MDNLLYLVFPKNAESGALETIPDTKGMIVIQEDDFLKLPENIINSNKICITSEATLENVLCKIDDDLKVNAIKSMKDKYLFRDLLTDMFPSLKYQTVELKDIIKLKLTSKKILKPVKGCFGTAVKTIDENSDIDRVIEEIKTEIKKNSAILSENVLSQSQFILEDFIEGEEYAVDMFFDSKGNPHIVNIYYHPIPKYSEYLHMLYYTNKNVFEKVYDKAMDFFVEINKKLQLKKITLHTEFKLSTDLIPIEINAMRYGGMGLGNMVYHSLNINPYKHFQEEQSPNWEKIWQKYPKENFAFLIAYNGTHIDVNKQKPNFQKLESQFSKVLNKTVFNYQKQLAFGIYTLKESSENIEKLLQIDFNDFFEDIEKPVANNV
ncbi:hypothetical protein HME9304_03227 [Flagellimonas maritima]|uniref:ATP-grasp domain-containing protein n=1 Tax=Flagellimonas maritima TaxID=1383885 RepID=A0A2Z4LW60_9FLAO|nr:ATP-grasp domain-containing protein [Allomuricauda aurantiaca]AWX46195.1 hypothetical protein HME9304_03227 [Allomuricauda aurantiaca]